MGATLSSSMV